ncbi:outer membrane protein assembly factor BamB family protein [Pseudocnuella soli]|uniref:outer membrane protein assembly factor BamB family protein n=1 Tax=Pseudocnuella soli TaxID=2502779 RepID=UPI00104C0F34|nr:PQQ-binding-like beta-propeller repeat protein [Pseudocnuella soli]
MIKKLFTLCFLYCLLHTAQAQSFHFAHVSDTHIGNQTAAEDLRRTVADINGNDSLSFVILSGDITEFGSDDELALARQILDSLNKPWYIIPGNHDGNWSESGANSFRRIFGAEHFRFSHGGYVFLGTNCGPNLRMSPGQVPREHIVWLDSTLKTLPDDHPIIYVNHYPQDTSLNNWYEATDRLKRKNIQLILLGHGHANRQYNFEGIPSIMGRSNLRAKDSIGAYNIVTIANGKAIYRERKPLSTTGLPWAEVVLQQHDFKKDTTHYYRPSFAVNKTYPQVKAVWTYQDHSDIGNGAAANAGLVFSANTVGEVYALNRRTGKKVWVFKTGGKVFSTPALSGNRLVVGSSDGNIYGLDAKSGKKLWQVPAQKAVLGSPLIHEGVAFIGASDGVFRAIDVQTGTIKWQFDQVGGFVVTRPLLYQGKIYFGCWNKNFYALDAQTGKLVWLWNNGNANRMFSPAACYPVAANNRIFIVAPDRYMTALDAVTGTQVWRNRNAAVRVRESMGISDDATLVYGKTMEGTLAVFNAAADTMQLVRETDLKLGYELAPTAMVEQNGLVFVPSDNGVVTAVHRKDGSIAWQHKLSNCLVTGILPLANKQVIVTTMDGKVACLKW